MDMGIPEVDIAIIIRGNSMKKLIIPQLILFFVFLSFSDTSARTYWRTYIIDEITNEGIILKDFEGKRFLVHKDPNKIKGGPIEPGDYVRFDTVKNKMKKNPWQPAWITEIGSNSITLELHNGETAQVNMKRGYRDQFKKGDVVEYKASKGHLKKSHLQPLE
jgi:hypothetical protein